MDQTTYTPKHRDSLSALVLMHMPIDRGDLPSQAGDPPPVHPSGLVVGRHRTMRLRDLDVIRSEAGAAVAWLMLAVWMVATAAVGVYAFVRMLEQAAATR